MEGSPMLEKTCDLVERVKSIADPRRQCQNLKHRLEDILVLGFCGALAGCDDFVEIADWANSTVSLTFADQSVAAASGCGVASGRAALPRCAANGDAWCDAGR